MYQLNIPSWVKYRVNESDFLSERLKEVMYRAYTDVITQVQNDRKLYI